MLIFSEKLRKFWNGWEVRGLILVSLILQIILIIFGSRRKFTVNVKVSIPVWSAYLIADAVATIALGNLAYSQADSDDKLSEPGNFLQAFWAPFLLLHLGGPDTITAYSLEDNELWLRHFLGLIIQVGVAFYVYLRSWSDNALTFIAIPMFITGIIKYGERTFVLMSSSVEHVKDSLLSFRIDHDLPDQESSYLYLAQAYFLFKRSAYLFANMTVDYYGLNDSSYSIMLNKTAEDAFKLVEAELGFMYDVLFTKATVVYSRFGIFLRCISFVSSISALIVFSIIIDIHAYPIADISLTYSLLVVAVFLEIYALVLLLLSDWTKIWLINLKTSEYNPTSRKLFHLLLSYFHSATATDSRQRWSRSMAQYNLISSCLDDKSATSIIVDFINKLVDIKYWFLTRKKVDSNLQNMIFEQLQEKSKAIISSFDDYVDKRQSLKKLLDRRGDYVLEKSHDSDIIWSTTEVDFDHSLLVWHIATDLYYNCDPDHQNLDGDINLKCKIISKHLSDYMLYLLQFCSSMLPKAISFETKYNDTYKEIKSTISISKSKEQKSDDTISISISEEQKSDDTISISISEEQKSDDIISISISEEQKSDDIISISISKEQKSDKFISACEVLLQYHKNKHREEDLSVLHHGVRLAKKLRTNEVKWKAISEVWIEMLTYAANRCAWKEHEKQLTNGGELLTQVSLLMAHLGLSEQYEMKKTSIRPLLPDREWQQLL
ncbi:hypothetical protein EZV62_003292 [Acer yangbiense]|uniref:DUF4220 domain-containing protein n=1 Tax=Acer yangbiense TaxID=1000413 RepID=A0A5C7IGA7_9ROSI|nr:hypothetical protein EZV62_003292 [Acer yangbiense]